MPECFEHFVQRGSPSGIGGCSCQHERQIAQIGRGFFEFGEPTDAHYCGDGTMPTCHHQVGAVLGCGYKPGNAPLGCFRHGQLVCVVQYGHAKTVQKSV